MDSTVKKKPISSLLPGGHLGELEDYADGAVCVLLCLGVQSGPTGSPLVLHLVDKTHFLHICMGSGLSLA